MYFGYYYLKKLKNIIQQNKDCFLYIYPCGEMTKQIIGMLDDNSLNKIQLLDKNEQVIRGKKTISPQKHNLNDKSVLYITSGKYELELRSVLKNVNYKGKIEKLFFDRIYSIYNNDKDSLFFNRMDLVLTTKCSLKCEKCANLMQYYRNPCDIPYDKIKLSMDKLMSAIDGIGTIYILGGEPFLYRELKETIHYLKKFKNIKNIKIVTNGTICFDDSHNDLWEELSDEKVMIHISDYGELSRKKQDIIKKCKQYGINIEIEENKFFYDTGNMQKRNRSEIELNKVFYECNTECRSLYNGELHYCPRSSHGVDLGFVEKRETDYVDCIKNCSTKMLREEIYKLHNKTDYVMACDYCDIRTPGYYERIFPAAVQSKEILSQY